jgi:alpha-1,2-mannosyltransferase
VQNGDLWWACLSLLAIWRLVARHAERQSQVVTNRSHSV